MSLIFNFVASLEVRFNKDVSVNSIKTLRSAETVPVVVIGSGETRMPVPPEILKHRKEQRDASPGGRQQAGRLAELRA